MKAKYPLTKFLSTYINDLRADKLKYNYEEFSNLFPASKTWAYNIAKNNMKDIDVGDLWKILLIQRNYSLFKEKTRQMKEFIEEGIEAGIVKNTTFEKMFPKKIPSEVLLGNACQVPETFIQRGYTEQCNMLFSEEEFPPDKRYVFVPFEDRYKLDRKLLEPIEKYISDEMKAIRKDRDKTLTGEYWLYAMELMFTDIDINNIIREKLKFICFDGEHIDNNTEFKWKHIYSFLNENGSISNLDYYSIPNTVYFDNTQEPMSEENLPSFIVRYDITEMRTSKSIKNDYFEEKMEDIVVGKIKLIDLFMIFYHQNFYESLNKNNQIIFQKTCIELLDYVNEDELPFFKLELFRIPKIEERIVDEELFALMVKINDFFRDKNKYNSETHTYGIKDKYKNNNSLMQFKSNINNCLDRFMNVVSIDFSFITKLPLSKDEELHKKLDNVVNEFKRNNLK